MAVIELTQISDGDGGSPTGSCRQPRSTSTHVWLCADAARRIDRGDPLLAGVREVVYQRSLPLATADLRIVASSSGVRAGIVGAAVLAIEHALAADAIDAMLA